MPEALEFEDGAGVARLQIASNASKLNALELINIIKVYLN